MNLLLIRKSHRAGRYSFSGKHTIFDKESHTSRKKHKRTYMEISVFWQNVGGKLRKTKVEGFCAFLASMFGGIRLRVKKVDFHVYLK